MLNLATKRNAVRLVKYDSQREREIVELRERKSTTFGGERNERKPETASAGEHDDDSKWMRLNNTRVSGV